MQHSYRAVTFPQTDSTERRTLHTMPLILFRGEGLWIWGARRATLIHSITVGNYAVFMANDEPLPALFFEAGSSYADFNNLIEKGKIPTIKDHQRLITQVCEIGSEIKIDIEGPATHIVMWGVGAP